MAPDWATVRVLVIEDDEDDFLITRDLLETQAPGRFRVEWANSYERGAARIADAEHDIYLLDYRLGTATGLDLVNEALAGGRTAPAILLTGDSDPAVDLEATRVGATDFLVKGELDGALLERAIRYALRHHKTLRELRESEERLHQAEARYRGAFDEAPIGVALVSVEPRAGGHFVEANRALCEISGYPERALRRTSLAAITHPEDAEAVASLLARVPGEQQGPDAVEIRLMDEDGAEVWTAISASRLPAGEGRPEYAIVQVQDIGERRRAEAQLRYVADHDFLTGLFNRRRFEQELARQVEFGERYGLRGAVLVLDLDRFKHVNDTLGHAAGDKLIARTGELLRSRLRSTDIVARLGGDEFAAILPSSDGEEAQRVAGEILERLRGQLVDLGGPAAQVTASIGIGLFPVAGGPEAVLGNADMAMYEAKKRGRDRVALLEGHPAESVSSRPA